MKNKFFRLIACLLVAAMLASIAVFPTAADENTDDSAVTTDSQTQTTDDPDADSAADGVSDGETAGEETAGEEATEGGLTEGETGGSEEEPAEDTEPVEEPAEEEEDEDDEEEIVFLTDEEEIARCTVAAENDSFILYLDEQYERIGLYVKESGAVHWTNCVNALLDDATSTPASLKTRLSNIAVKYGNATDLTTSQSYLYSYRESTEDGDTTFELVDNGVKVTYDFRTVDAEIPVYYVITDEYLEVYIVTDEINEKSGYVEGVTAEESETDVTILTDIAIGPYMSAADSSATGYMLIPDGSGAIINLNNGKTNYSNYKATLYGDDVANVRELMADVTEQAYLPVMAMVKGNDGLVMIATDGDTFASANAGVAYNKNDNAGYNYCYFSFMLRSTDTYNMAGQSNILVFERGDGSIPVERLAVRYYPITSDNEVVSYTEIADVYRNYLIEEKGLTKVAQSDYAPLFIDFYGGTLKSKSILGIPIDVKTAFTTFEEAVEIVSELMELGVTDFVVNYNDWSNDSMSGKIDTGDSIAGCLGGRGDYEDMIEFFAENNVDFYNSLDSYTFTSNGNGFWTLFDTAYRISRSYARPYNYNIVYGTPEPGVAPALLAPKSIADLSEKVTKNLSKYEGAGAGLGSFSSKLWSDFSTRNHTNRATTAQYIMDMYASLKESAGKIIADAPNAYLLPYVDTVKNLTLESSQFKIVDQDIPFVQMVLHGYIPYSTEAINGSPDSKEQFLKAIAAGSNIQYDFIYSSATEVSNTDYDNLYYATYEGWVDECIGEYQIAKEVLSLVSDSVMTGYEVDGSVITTTYENGVVTTVDLDTGVITADGKIYNYSDYVDEGGLR